MEFIYALKDPSGETRYIGKTNNPQERLCEHLRLARNGESTHKANWIRGLIKAGQVPTLEIIEVVERDWCERERYWIALHREMGTRLTNHTDGGDGASGLDRSRMEHVWEANRGRPATEERKRKVSASMKGKKKTPEHIEAMRRSRLGTTKGTAGKPGSQNVSAKLTEDNVREIRRLRAEGISGTAVAQMFGITPACVSQIWLRRTWTHL